MEEKNKRMCIRQNGQVQGAKTEKKKKRIKMAWVEIIGKDMIIEGEPRTWSCRPRQE